MNKKASQITSNKNTIRILVVDDHRFIHEIISKILNSVIDIEIIGHASNGAEAVQLCQSEKPDIVLMDIVMPVMDGLETTRTIHGQHPDIKILILSSFQDHESVGALLKSGATGYITKSSLTQELIHIIRTTASGQTVFSAEVMSRLIVSTQSPQMIYKFNLTDREIEVLVLLADGLQNQQIAQKLEISISTVKYHTNNILQKLGVQTRAEALVVAIRNNLI